MEIVDKVKTIFGNVETVMSVEDAQITTFESFCKNNWYHPTKVFPVYWSETLEKYVSVPEDGGEMHQAQQKRYIPAPKQPALSPQMTDIHTVPIQPVNQFPYVRKLSNTAYAEFCGTDLEYHPCFLSKAVIVQICETVQGSSVLTDLFYSIWTMWTIWTMICKHISSIPSSRRKLRIEREYRWGRILHKRFYSDVKNSRDGSVR